MAVLDRLERFLFETRAWKLIAAPFVPYFAETGIWGIEYCVPAVISASVPSSLGSLST